MLILAPDWPLEFARAKRANKNETRGMKSGVIAKSTMFLLFIQHIFGVAKTYLCLVWIFRSTDYEDIS